MARFIFLGMIFFLLNGCGSVPTAKSSSHMEHPSKINNEKDSNSDNNKKDVQEQVNLEAKALLAKQLTNFPRIIKELETQKRKVSHWVWWVFPSEKAGDSEPSPKTKIELSDAGYVLKNADVDTWAEILEEINALLKTHPKGSWKNDGNIPNDAIVPSIDHGRIKFSLQFWLSKARDVIMHYPRLYQAFKQLEAFNW